MVSHHFAKFGGQVWWPSLVAKYCGSEDIMFLVAEDETYRFLR